MQVQGAVLCLYYLYNVVFTEWKAQNCAAFQIKSEEGTSEDWKWSRIWVWTDLDAFPPWHAASEFRTNSRPVYDFIPSF